jgi:hypothetical protein
MSFTFQDTPDLVYYDVTITNLEGVDTVPPVLYFNETRNSPFILDPESYYLSIVRFTLDTPSLPVFQPEIVPNQSNRDLTIYTVSLSWTNPVAPFQTFNQQQPVIWSPQIVASPLPAPPSQTSNKLQNNSTGYYETLNYQYWIYLINQTFIQCFANLNAQVVAAALVLPTIHAPVLSWDTVNNIAIMNADVAGYNTSSANHIGIYFNPAMFQLFSSFPCFILSYQTAVAGKNVQIQPLGFGGANIVEFPPSAPPASQYQAYQIVQEYSTVALWTPITSIVFTSNTLPIVPNNISAPLLFINGQIFNNGGNNSNISQVITDFVSDTGIYKPSIVYTPTAQYRLVNLVGNTPVYNLDINVFWKDRVGVLQPFRLTSGSTATIKILFQRKNPSGSSVAYPKSV